MARTRKSIQPLNLYKYDVLIEDRGPRSDYFKVSQFDGYFYGGRNAFLVAGTGILRPNTKILVEILSIDGTTVYSAPITQFVEGNSRLIQVEVYNDTPIGAGKLVIMGCTQTYMDGTPVPEEWKEKLNVRWITDVIISPLIENKTPIRFVATPSIVVEEKFYKIPSSSIFTEKVLVPVNVQLSPKYYNVFHNGYQIKLLGPPGTEFISDYEAGILTGSVTITNGAVTENADISLPINRIFNSNLAESDGKLIYTDKNKLITDGIFSSSGAYTTYIDPFGTSVVTSSMDIQYSKLQTFNTGSSISYAKLRITDAKTLSGEINKVRVSYKIATEPGDYIVLSDVDVGVQELLSVDSSSKVVETGLFKNLLIDDYWYTATMSLQKNETAPTLPSYYQSSSLISSSIPTIQYGSDILDGINTTPQIINNAFISGASYFIGTRTENPIELFPRSEYTLAFDALVSKTSASVQLNQSDYSLEVYLVLQENSTSKLLSTDNRGQLIGTLTPSSNFIKQNFERVEFNFTPKIIEFGQFGLRFVVYGGNWSVANISVKPAQEPFFSPDEIDILVPNVNYTDKILSYKVQYLDINNNSVGVSTLSIPTYFTGSDVTAIGFLTTSSIATVVDTYTFVGDGTTTQYQVSSSYDNTSLLVAVGGVTYISPDDYYISSSTVIFTEPPTSASNVSIKAIVNVTENAVGSFSGSFVGSFTGSMFGTSSWAQNVISSSYATTSSAATSITFTPSTASFATTASAATSITFTPSTSSFANTASAATSITFTPSTASFAATSSAATSITFIPISASYSITSSYATNAAGLTNGTGNYIPLWTSATAQSSSTIYQNGVNIGIGTTTPARILTVYVSGSTSRVLLQNSSTGQAINNGLDLSIGTDGLASVWNYQNADIRFATNNTEQLRITSGGFVGVGTSTPYSLLQLKSNSETTALSLFTPGYDSTKQWGTRIWKNDIGGGIPLQLDTQYLSTWYSSSRVDHGQDTSHPSLTTYYHTQLAVLSGNVGIGTTTPVSKLDINGDINISGSSRRIYADFSTSSPISSRTMFQSNVTNGNTNVYAIPNGTSQATSFTVGNSSSVDNSSIGQFIATATEISIRANIVGTGTYLPFTIYTNASERLRIDTSGYVGIGTTSPTTPLNISYATHGLYAQYRPSSGSGVGQEMYYQFNNSAGSAVSYASIYAELSSSTAGAHGGHMELRTANGGTLNRSVRILGNGNVGIGTLTPTAKLHVEGDISASLIFVSGTLGQPLTQTSSSVSTGEYIYDTGITVTTLVPDGPAVYELLAQYNPNTSGASQYRNILHGHIYIEDGYDGVQNVVTAEYNELYRAIGSGSYDSSGANVNVSFVNTAGAATNTEQITLPYASGSWQLRIRFSNNSTSPGTPSYRIVRLLRKL